MNTSRFSRTRLIHGLLLATLFGALSACNKAPPAADLPPPPPPPDMPATQEPVPAPEPTPAPAPGRRRDRRDDAPPMEYPEYDDGDGGTGAGPRRNGAAAAALRPSPGLEALKLAVHRPDDVADRLDAVLFTDPLQRAAFVALLEHDSVQDAVESASPEIADVLRRVTVDEPLDGDPELGDPVDAVIAGMVRQAVWGALAEMEQYARAGGAEWQATAAETAQVSIWLGELDDSTAGRDAADRLVAWLSGRKAAE